MEMLLALLLQSAVAPEGADSARGPRLSYGLEADAPPPGRPRVNQGRSARIDWGAMDQSLASESRSEQPRRAPPVRTRPAPGRTTMWNGVPVRMIDGQPHGVW